MRRDRRGTWRAHRSGNRSSGGPQSDAASQRVPRTVRRRLAGFGGALGERVLVDRPPISALRRDAYSRPGSPHGFPHPEQLSHRSGTGYRGRRRAHRRIDDRHRADHANAGRRSAAGALRWEATCTHRVRWYWRELKKELYALRTDTYELPSVWYSIRRPRG